jgi:glycosyltransferase involved in cell wall biosynthesis
MPRPLHTLARVAALLAAFPVLSARAVAGAVRPGRVEGEEQAEGSGAEDTVYVVVPYPPGGKSGGARAIGGLLRALEGGFRVEPIPLYELRPAGGRIRHRLADWLTHALPIPVHCRPFAMDGRTVRRRIADGRPVVIEFLSGSLFLLFGGRPANRLVLREHEPLCRRLWSERRTAAGAERMLLPLQGVLAWLAMTAVYVRVDRIVALTEQDAAYLRRAFPFAAGKVAAVPVSLDLPPAVAVAAAAPGSGREVLMLGNFHHRPNVDGLRWWLGEVAPRLGDGWTLHLCGLDGPLDGADLPPSPVRVVRHGFVEDVGAAFAGVPIAVAPVISGGGVRMKNLELAALGKAIVTTSLGNEGIGLVDGREAVVVDDPGAMAAALRRLDAHPAAAGRMGARAAARVRAGFGHAAVLARFRELLGVPAVDAEDAAAARVASHAASSARETAGVGGGRESVVHR